MRHGLIRNQCCGGEEILAFAGSRVGMAGTCVSKCRLVVGMPVIAALSFLKANRLKVPQQA